MVETAPKAEEEDIPVLVVVIAPVTLVEAEVAADAAGLFAQQAQLLLVVVLTVAETTDENQVVASAFAAAG